MGSAIALPSGMVIVLGDAPDTDALPFVERFDPATGSWTGLRSLRVARTGLTATLLPSGLVLVVCGDPVGAAAATELYDPSVAP